jgi:hypothetical protein
LSAGWVSCFCTRLPCSTDDEFPVIAEQGISSEMPKIRNNSPPEIAKTGRNSGVYPVSSL